MFGDPHILTLDGHQYTFNGKGEFILLTTLDSSFTLQGRMLDTRQDFKGTVFMAFVAKQFDSSAVQFEVSEQMNVMVDGDVLDFSELNIQTFDNVIVSNLGNNSFSARFSSGVYIKLKQNNGIISDIIVTVPSEFYENTRGLLGIYNRNPSDDLLPREQSLPLPLISSLEDIHYNFGLTCKFHC